jgi:hypothetical protein
LGLNGWNMPQSKRESIIQNVVTSLEAVSGIRKPIQRVLPAYQHMDNYAATQFPLCVVVGGLPRPLKPLELTGLQPSDSGIVSTLQVGIYIYFVITPTVHEQLDEVAQAVWAALGIDPKWGGLARSTRIECNPDISHVLPYVAINMNCFVNYVHSTLTL